MPIYEYRCAGGHREMWDLDVNDRDDPLLRPCGECGKELRRRFSFLPGLVMHSHFNETVGKEVSSMRQFNDELKRMNERNTERTGIEHKAEAVIPSDVKPGE
jgi:hypothetical protein